MLFQNKIDYTFELNSNIGIFSFNGDLTVDHEDDLKLILMKALYGTDRAVLNLGNVRKIDDSCMKLLKKAYLVSIRLKNPVIFTEVPKTYIQELFDGKDIEKMRRSPNDEPLEHAI